MVSQELVSELASTVGGRFGLPLRPVWVDRGGYRGWALRYSAQADEGIGFDILLSASHHYAEAMFRPAPFAGPLLRELAVGWRDPSDPWARELSAVDADIKVSITINGEIRDTKQPFTGEPIQDLEIDAVCRLAEKGPEGLMVGAKAAVDVTLALVLGGLQAEVEIEGEESLLEGMAQRLTTNRYERNPLARSKCIEHYGWSCWACDFDFSEAYGVVGADFIEVHHRVPVSSIGKSYVVDPIRDLIPLCSNCHSMAHRTDPPTSPEQLRSSLGMAPKVGLPVVKVDASYRVEISACMVQHAEPEVVVISVSDGDESWVAPVAMKEFHPVLDLADVGMGSDLPVSGEEEGLPVTVSGDLVECRIGSALLYGTVTDWAALLERAHTKLRDDSPPQAALLPLVPTPRRVGVAALLKD